MPTKRPNDPSSAFHQDSDGVWYFTPTGTVANPLLQWGMAQSRGGLTAADHRAYAAAKARERLVQVTPAQQRAFTVQAAEAGARIHDKRRRRGRLRGSDGGEAYRMVATSPALVQHTVNPGGWAKPQPKAAKGRKADSELAESFVNLVRARRAHRDLRVAAAQVQLAAGSMAAKNISIRQTAQWRAR